MPAAAAAFAAAGNVDALDVLLTRHPYATGAAALPALAALPPSLPAAATVPLLARLLAFSATPPPPPRPPDAAEAAALVAAVPPEALAGPCATEAACAGAPLATPDSLDAWVLERAAAVDDEAGLAVAALALLKAWAAHGRSAAAAAAGAVHMWLTVLRHGTADEAFAALGVRELLDMTGPAQLRAALVATLPEGLATDAAAAVVTEARPLSLSQRACISLTTPRSSVLAV